MIGKQLSSLDRANGYKPLFSCFYGCVLGLCSTLLLTGCVTSAANVRSILGNGEKSETVAHEVSCSVRAWGLKLNQIGSYSAYKANFYEVESFRRIVTHSETGCSLIFESSSPIEIEFIPPGSRTDFPTVIEGNYGSYSVLTPFQPKAIALHYDNFRRHCEKIDDAHERHDCKNRSDTAAFAELIEIHVVFPQKTHPTKINRIPGYNGINGKYFHNETELK